MLSICSVCLKYKVIHIVAVSKKVLIVQCHIWILKRITQQRSYIFSSLRIEEVEIKMNQSTGAQKYILYITPYCNKGQFRITKVYLMLNLHYFSFNCGIIYLFTDGHFYSTIVSEILIQMFHLILFSSSIFTDFVTCDKCDIFTFYTSQSNNLTCDVRNMSQFSSSIYSLILSFVIKYLFFLIKHCVISLIL